MPGGMSTQDIKIKNPFTLTHPPGLKRSSAHVKLYFCGNLRSTPPNGSDSGCRDAPSHDVDVDVVVVVVVVVVVEAVFVGRAVRKRVCSPEVS